MSPENCMPSRFTQSIIQRAECTHNMININEFLATKDTNSVWRHSPPKHHRHNNMTSERVGESNIWRSDIKYALGCYRILGRGLGFWPESRTVGAKARIFLVIVTQLWMSLSLIRSLLVKGNCGAITDVVDVLSLIICGFLTVMKVVIPKIHQENMWLVINSALNDWSRVRDNKSREIMMKYAYIGRIVFIVQMCGAYVAGFPLIFMRLPGVNALWSNTDDFSRQLPIGPKCWISDDQSTYVYVGEYILQSIQLFIVCTAYIGCDTYFFGIAMHVCGQFELLNMSVDHLYEYGDELKQKQRLNTLINRHNHLLQLVNNFEETYTVIILAQVVGDALLICTSGVVLLMSLSTGDFIIIVGLIVRIYLVYVQLFMFCYVGEQLSSYGDKLQTAVYNCPWYSMSPSIVQDMKFVIMRNNYRFYLTAGKMYSMNIQNFKNLLKTMASFFSVLRLAFQDHK